jgi:aromatic ring-opening dioxygenase catalytic subunit (LigB family)
MSFHNLNQFTDAEKPSKEFDDWLSQTLNYSSMERHKQLLNWAQAPSARVSHPREEHLIPLMVVSGADSHNAGKKIWHGLAGNTRISSWAFE